MTGDRVMEDGVCSATVLTGLRESSAAGEGMACSGRLQVQTTAEYSARTRVSGGECLAQAASESGCRAEAMALMDMEATSKTQLVAEHSESPGMPFRTAPAMDWSRRWRSLTQDWLRQDIRSYQSCAATTHSLAVRKIQTILADLQLHYEIVALPFANSRVLILASRSTTAIYRLPLM